MCWPWPRLVIIDNIVCVYVCVFWPWPRWLLCVLCVIVCVNLNCKWPWPRLVILTMTCVCFGLGLGWFDNSLRVCVLALASVGYY